MNFEAYAKMEEAQREYLLANGWRDQGNGSWHDGRVTKRFGHAVNTQLLRDRGAVDLLPREARESLPAEQAEIFRKLYGPWTVEEKGVNFRRLLRDTFHRRHGPGNVQRNRQDVRSWVRTISRLEEPTTRVERARRVRAEHAGQHKQHGCPCGKEGPPW